MEKQTIEFIKRLKEEIDKLVDKGHAGKIRYYHLMEIIDKLIKEFA